MEPTLDRFLRENTRGIPHVGVGQHASGGDGNREAEEVCGAVKHVRLVFVGSEERRGGDPNDEE